MGRVLGAGTQREHGQKLGEGIDGQPEKDAGVWSYAAGCAVRPMAGAGAADGRSNVRVRPERASPRATERLVMVACREPKTRWAADGSSPSARAESTTATWCEGVFSR
jgi:hypothetical protein